MAARRRTEELWDRLGNESARAYEGFKVYMYMPPMNRTLVGAYRAYVENPDAKVAPLWFKTWFDDYAWADRVRAYDNHIESIRRRGMEKAIEAEAQKQTRAAESVRFRLNELMTMGFEEAMTWLEKKGYEGMRASDVVAIIRLHLEHVDKLGGQREESDADDWTEDDDEFVAGVVADLESAEAQGASIEDVGGSAEEGVQDS